MASLNLSTNGPSISKSYQTVVNAPPPSASGQSPTAAQWALFSVSTPLVSAFQQDAGKESVLKVQSSGEGELVDLIEEFSEGRVQFAYVKVTDPNTGLPKNVLIGWCGEGVPERTKGYFTSHLATVSKFLHGYHVQVTARADGDLTPEGIIQRVADSSGSKYSAGEASAPAPAPRPAVASKPAFTPTRSGGLPLSPSARVQPAPRANVDNDGWGDDAPPVTRTQLEKVQPAYQPTRVNLQELKSNPTATRQSAAASNDAPDVVRGGYQPIGKVDIAAIRRQAAESGQLKDERPSTVKGSYEPVGKVDIAAIRARAQKPEGAGANVSSPAVNEPEPATTLPERPAPAVASGRLTDLPKPKVANKFGGGPSFPGTKPPLPVGLDSKPSSNAQIGAASRTFADEGGKTPAQIWAERKAKERGAAPSGAAEPAPAPIQSQSSGQGEWKSSYAGKSWATVQTAHERSQLPEPEVDARATDPAGEQPQPRVRDVQEHFTQEASAPPAPPAPVAPPIPQASRPVPLPGLSPAPEPESEPEHDAQQVLPPPPPQPRSPTPPSPVRDSSPIRIAMPVGQSAPEATEVADAHEEQHSPPPAMPVRSLQEAVPDERDLEDDSHDLGRAAAEATAPGPEQTQGGPRAQIQYDYEKAEDNEIELREGDYVTDIEMVDEDWWVGVNSRGERGLFPANYVEVIDDGASPAPAPAHHEPEPEPEPIPTPAPAPVPAAVPLPPAPAAAPAAAAPAAAAPASKGRTATALYDYEAAEDNEIGFPENAKISNVEFPDDDWWLGEYNGRQGLFPANYVQLD
ncbi:unnamed protein product [Penicillium salamii]|nr:unnamed protein product [Penicillium salamii]CAG8391152.1 unnamed protein product [Penicillium salamii]